MPKEKQTFWTSISGILTGIAAIITATTGLYVAITGLYIAIVGKDQPLPSQQQPSLQVEATSANRLLTNKETAGQPPNIYIHQELPPASMQRYTQPAKTATVDKPSTSKDTSGQPPGIAVSQVPPPPANNDPKVAPATQTPLDTHPAKKNTPGIRPETKQERQFILKAIIDDPDGYTNVRRLKSASSDIVTKVYDREQFYTYVQDGNWWQIKTKDGRVGYMHVSRIKIIKGK